MQFKRQLRVEEGVNLTPLIDVVFLLLIFFMVSTTFTKESHLTITLPEATGEQIEAPIDSIEIVVDGSGAYILNGQALINTQAQTLEQGLLELAGEERSMPLIITGDSKAPYQSIITVMDVAGQMGFVNHNLTVLRPEESP